MTKSELEQYKGFVEARLKALSPFLQNYALGDFSERIEIPDQEDEFTELLVGLALMVDDIKEMIREKEDTITKLRQAEEALRESEELFSKAFHASPIITTITSLKDGRFIDVNETFVQLSGYRRDEVIGRSVLELDIYGDPAKRAETIRLMREEREVHDREIKIRTRSGEKLDILVSSAAIEIGGEPCVLMVGYDTTERKRTEQELFLKNIVFESSIASNSIADRDGNITHVNPAFLEMWGYETKEEACGNSVASFFVNPEDAGPVMEALVGIGQWEGEFLAKRRDGSTFVSRGLATIVCDEKGGQIGYQSANLDVTAQRQMEKELTQRLAELERFNRLAVGRELRMVELKRQVNQLSEQLGKEPPYDVSFVEENIWGS
jgi:PAS domain S-box-containing protein